MVLNEMGVSQNRGPLWAVGVCLGYERIAAVLIRGSIGMAI